MAIDNVLVVEDEVLLLEMMTVELEDAGLAVLQAATSDKGLEILASGRKIDLLFTDIRLPGAMDGWQLAEAARRLRPSIRVVYATGYSTAAPRPVSGSMFFTKPYRPSAIVAAIETLAASQSTGDANA